MSIGISIRITGDDVEGALRRLIRQGSNTRPAMRAISETLLDSIEEAFDQQADPETGEAWTPLSAVTIAKRTAEGTWPGRMLQVSQGGLASSFSASFGDRIALAGSNKVYARILHMGGQAGRGRKVTIPGRKYAGLTRSHRQEVLAILARHLRA